MSHFASSIYIILERLTKFMTQFRRKVWPRKAFLERRSRTREKERFLSLSLCGSRSINFHKAKPQGRKQIVSGTLSL
jgi:hypothetical protein